MWISKYIIKSCTPRSDLIWHASRCPRYPAWLVARERCCLLCEYLAPLKIKVFNRGYSGSKLYGRTGLRAAAPPSHEGVVPSTPRHTARSDLRILLHQHHEGIS